MFAWLNSLNSLSMLKNILQFLTVICATGTALTAILEIKLKKRWLSFSNKSIALTTAVLAFLLWQADIQLTSLQETEEARIKSDIDTTKVKLNKTQIELINTKAKLDTTEKILTKLKTEAIKSSRGIVEIFDFQGIKRIETPGGSRAIAGEEFGIFQKMQSLIQENNIPELINLCENQILKTPSWLTPYFYLGLVYEELGDKEKAIKNLKYVIDNAPGDPDYEKAKEVLNLLETK